MLHTEKGRSGSAAPAQNSGGTDQPPETDGKAVEPLQAALPGIIINDSLPTLIGGTAALTIAGVALAPALIAGLFSGALVTALRSVRR